MPRDSMFFQERGTYAKKMRPAAPAADEAGPYRMSFRQRNDSAVKNPGPRPSQQIPHCVQNDNRAAFSTVRNRLSVFIARFPAMTNPNEFGLSGTPLDGPAHCRPNLSARRAQAHTDPGLFKVLRQVSGTVSEKAHAAAYSLTQDLSDKSPSLHAVTARRALHPKTAGSSTPPRGGCARRGLS